MAKPRVIIADKDENYIAPMQLKFAKDFFDLIDIEIITNQEYFDELFLKPQKAEILIVSDDMYNSSLQKHNISNIFVMMEQYEDEQTGDLNVSRLFKYTSIKEIFNEIIGKSASVLNVESNSRKETQILLFASAAGGVGKTTVAMGVAASLSMNYKRVLYINASRLQSFQWLLNNKTPITDQEIYRDLVNIDTETYGKVKHSFRKEFFDYMPPFKASLLALGLNYDLYGEIALLAKKSNDYDFIVIDSETSFDECKLKLLDIADKVIVITEQSANSVEATNTLISNINFSNSEKYIFVCNKFSKERENRLVSPAINIKFSINEYIDEFYEGDRDNLEIVAKSNGIKKISYIVV